MTCLVERGQIITLVRDAINSGARQDRACAVIRLGERTLQRWQVDQTLGDQRPYRIQKPSKKLSLLERKHVLTVANSDEFGSLPPSQIVPILAGRGEYIASESTFYRILRAESAAAPRR